VGRFARKKQRNADVNDLFTDVLSGANVAIEILKGGKELFEKKI